MDAPTSRFIPAGAVASIPLNVAEIYQTNSQALHSVFDFRRGEGNQFGCARFGKRAAKRLQFGAGIAGMAHQFGDSGLYGSEEFAQRPHVQESGVGQAAKCVGADEAGRAQLLSEWPGQGSHSVRYGGAVPFGQEGAAMPQSRGSEVSRFSAGQRMRRMQNSRAISITRGAMWGRTCTWRWPSRCVGVTPASKILITWARSSARMCSSGMRRQRSAMPEAHGTQVELAALVDQRGDQGGV